MQTKREVIGWVLEDNRREQLLVRGEDGQVSAQTNESSGEFSTFAIQTGAFRRAKRILDPLTQELVGYETEVLQHSFGAVA